MNYKGLRKNRHILYHLHLEKKKTFRGDFFLLKKRSFHFLASSSFSANILSYQTAKRLYSLGNYKKLRKNRHLISPTSREKEDFQRRLFFTEKEKFPFSGKFVIFSEYPLISDCKEIVQPRELQKTKKKQTSYITYISRKRRLFLLTKRSFKFSGKWPFWPYLDPNKTEYRW